MTTAYANAGDVVVAAEEVYAAQQDSQLLIEVMAKTGLAAGRRVADLCTGSGVVALAAAEQGASAVTAFDICTRAVRCARANALARRVNVEVHLGSWARAVEYGPIDLVVCNPPYVPHDPDDAELVSAQAGPARAVNAGRDGRLVLDPLCAAAPELLVDGGSMLVVHSEFAGVQTTLNALNNAGLHSDVVVQQSIPFGPVLTARGRVAGEYRAAGGGATRGKIVRDQSGETVSDAEPRLVRVVPCGPVMVQGPVRIETPDGTVVESDRFMVAICACRKSKTYPLCDTSHRRRRRTDE